MACRDVHLQVASLIHGDPGPCLHLLLTKGSGSEKTRSQRQGLRTWQTLTVMSSTQFIGEETEAPKKQNKQVPVHSPSKAKPGPKASLSLASQPTRMSKSWPYFSIYLPKTMINEFKYPKCHSGWETINFFQTSLDILLFSPRKKKKKNPLRACVYVYVLVPQQWKLY